MNLKHLLALVILSILSFSPVNAEPSSTVLELLQSGEFNKAEKLLVPIAESGDLPTQALLGQLYLYQLEDYDKAFKWTSIAVENGHKDAIFDLANLYDEGHGVKQDKKKAFSLYLQSAEQGMDFAQLEVAMAYQLGKNVDMDLEKAAYWHHKAAKNDMQKSHLVLGTLYYSGIGLKKDVIEARYWLNRAVKGGGGFADDASNLLDLMDEENYARDKDDLIGKSLEQAREGKFKKAKELIEELATNGNADAQYLLSKYYRDPDGLNQPKIGEEWLYKAAHNNHANAQYDIAWNLSAGWIEADVDTVVKVIYWMERAGYNGNNKAYANLATLYDKERRDVLSEMEKSAYDGNAMAAYNLGWIYARGLLTEDGLMQDKTTAKKWFEKSGKLGFNEAALMLKRGY
jgi:uncharacterized protein